MTAPTTPRPLTAPTPAASAPEPRSTLRVDRRGVVVWLAVVLAIGLLLFAYRHLEVLASGDRVSFLKPLINEVSAAFGAGLLFWGVLWLTRRVPLDRGGWERRLPVYAGGLAVFSVLHTSWNWGARELLYRLAGFGDYDYGRMPLRYAMEFPVHVVSFVLMVAAIHGVRRVRAAREREVRTARLESNLARAELRNLRLQLQPHFLFNALNTISATMYEDPAAADEMIDRLAELLRASLRTAQTDEVPLATELEVLDCYLAILHARFRERLEVTVEVPAELGGARVPSMILQPLVENAVRHGSLERHGRGAVTVRARRDGDGLVLEVADDGPGIAAGRDPLGAGLGLSATAERLHLLYGDRHRLEAGNRPEGGFRVAVRLPYREERAA